MRTWKIDTTHSTIGFVVRHMLVSKVRGRFNRWRGELRFDEADPLSAEVTAQIDAGSVDTNERQRDAHLRSADFLDVARFAAISFTFNQVLDSGGLALGDKVEIEVEIEAIAGQRATDLEP